MKILIISRCPPHPLHLGDRLIVAHLGEELEGRKHEIDLLAFADRPSDWHEQHEYDYHFGHVELVSEPRRTPLDLLKRLLIPSARFPRRAEDAWSPDMWRAIRRRLDTEQYDVVQVFGGVQVYEVFHALRGLPAIITPYESYSLYLRRLLDNTRRPLSRLTIGVQWQLARAFERWMFARYARTVVVSPRDRDELLAINPALRIDVIPNGVDTHEFRSRPTERLPDTLLFTGNYEYAPNVDAALRLATEILPQVQARSPGVKLWLVGNAPPPELEALASDIIRVTGRVPDIKPYLSRATVFVSPLRLGAGIKNKVLEALAMGCPLVATPLSVDGIGVTDGHDALIADDTQFVDAIVRLLYDDDLRARLSLNGRALIEAQYSWMQVGERYEQLYTEITR